jgi:hypothetical protein
MASGVGEAAGLSPAPDGPVVAGPVVAGPVVAGRAVEPLEAEGAWPGAEAD